MPHYHWTPKARLESNLPDKPNGVWKQVPFIVNTITQLTQLLPRLRKRTVGMEALRLKIDRSVKGFCIELRAMNRIPLSRCHQSTIDPQSESDSPAIALQSTILAVTAR
ncbi:MAG: hypothetical protein ACI9R3_002010 [Verrucomicrobiales bacterium]|jgi:hypothetical protein